MVLLCIDEYEIVNCIILYYSFQLIRLININAALVCILLISHFKHT